MSGGAHYEAAERPAILINAAPDARLQVVDWVRIGAEEEGVPCQDVSDCLAQPGADAAALAYRAAQSSRIGVGVGAAQGQIALHEAHLPPNKPVLSFALGSQPRPVACLVGSNAGRFVKRMPLRLADPSAPASAAPQSSGAAPQVAILENFFDAEQTWGSSMLSQIVHQVNHPASPKLSPAER